MNSNRFFSFLNFLPSLLDFILSILLPPIAYIACIDRDIVFEPFSNSLQSAHFMFLSMALFVVGFHYLLRLLSDYFFKD